MRPSEFSEEISAFGGLALVGALVFSLMSAWNNPAADGRYAVNRAGTLLREGRYLQATDLLEHNLLTYTSPDLRLTLSYAYLARHDAERAERQARLGIGSADPNLLPVLWTQLGRVLYYSGRASDATAAWSAAVEAGRLSVGNPLTEVAVRSSTWHIAMTEWDAGNWAATQRNLEHLVETSDIYGVSARVKLSQLLATTDDARSQALLANLKVTTANSEWVAPDLRLSGLHEGLRVDAIPAMVESLHEAQKQVSAARGKGEGEASIAALWGNFYLREGEVLLAKRYLERAIALQPAVAGPHAQLAVALLSLGDEQSALSHLRTAVTLDPGQLLSHHLLARIYTGRKDWSSAAAEFQTLRKLEPNAIELHMQLAEYHMARGEYDEAEAEYKEAVKIQKSGANGSAPDAALALSRFYTDIRGFGCQGLEPAQDSLLLHPDDPSSTDAVGWSLVLCGRPADAVSSLEKAVSTAPDVPRYSYHLAHAYELLGRKGEALDEYNRVRDLDPGGPWERLALKAIVNLGRK